MPVSEVEQPRAEQVPTATLAHEVAAPLEGDEHAEYLTDTAPRGLGDLRLREPCWLVGEQLENVERLVERRYRVAGLRHRSAPMTASIRLAISRSMSSGTGWAPGASDAALVATRSRESA